MKLSVQTYKVSDGVPATPKNVSQKFTSYHEPRLSMKPKWQGREGDYTEDGHKYKEICRLCGKVFAEHYDNHCYNGDKEGRALSD
jgi:hypothetical protein